MSKTAVHSPRLVDGLLLGTRRTAAVLLTRHPDHIRRRLVPVACDVHSHALLYDLDDAARLLADTPRRYGCLTSTDA